MGFIKFIEFSVQPGHIVRRWIFILRAEMTLQWAVNLRGALKGRRKVAAPGAENIAAVIGHRRREIPDWRQP